VITLRHCEAVFWLRQSKTNNQATLLIFDTCYPMQPQIAALLLRAPRNDAVNKLYGTV
ncbi:MAG: hypothetical protein ACI9CF_001392, partial [Candidatus Omnitrophota bacterium]